MMNVVLSEHAIYQMQERNIRKDLIDTALKNPDKIVLQSNLRKQAIKLFKQHRKRYLLIIIYDENNTTQKVITALITSKIKKYMSL